MPRGLAPALPDHVRSDPRRPGGGHSRRATPVGRVARTLAVLVSVGLVGLACMPAGPQAPGAAPGASPAAQADAPKTDASKPDAAKPDASLEELQRQNAALQATLTAQQGQSQIVSAQQTQSALQTAVAGPPAAAAAKPTEAPAAAKPNPTQPAAATTAPQPTSAPAAPAQPTAAPAAPAASSGGGDTPEAVAKAFMQSMVNGDVAGARNLMSAQARSGTSSDLDKLSTGLRPCGSSSLNTDSPDSRGATRTVFVTFLPACGSYNEVFGPMVPLAAPYTEKVFGDARITGCGVDLQQENNQWRVISRAIGCVPAYR